MRKKQDEAKLRPTKMRQLRVAWEQVPGYHGILVIEIRHSQKDMELYRLQQVPRMYYLDLLHRPDPEVLVNQLLRCYLGSGE